MMHIMPVIGSFDPQGVFSYAKNKEIKDYNTGWWGWLTHLFGSSVWVDVVDHCGTISRLYVPLSEVGRLFPTLNLKANKIGRAFACALKASQSPGDAQMPLDPSLGRKILNEKRKQALQLQQFEKYARDGNWGGIHSAHYDWWMFPINKTSVGGGDQYYFPNKALEELRKDKEFMDSFRRGVALEALAWGWDIKNNALVAAPGKDQRWTGYGIRLAKMADSLWLLGEFELFQSMQLFATQMVSSAGLSDKNLVLHALHMKETRDGFLVPNPHPDLSYHNPRPPR
jgi:hypothetical protein